MDSLFFSSLNLCKLFLFHFYLTDRNLLFCFHFTIGHMLFFFYNLIVIIGDRGFEPWMFLLEIQGDDDQLSYKALGDSML